MIHQDWLTRLIEQLGLALAQIQRLKLTQQYDEATLVVERLLEQVTGLGLISIRFLRVEDILARLIRSDSDAEGRDRALITATLLAEAGGIYLAQDRGELSCEMRLKALEITLRALLGVGEAGLPEGAPDVDELLASVTPCYVPSEVRLLTMAYFERHCDFARAEDALFDAIETHPDDARVLDEGLALCERLLALDDAALARGRLPRDEVEEALAELEARTAMTTG